MRARASKELMREMQRKARTPVAAPTQQQRRNFPGPILVKLDDHLPAPTDDFEATDFTPTTVHAKRFVRRGEQNRVRQTHHFELDDIEDDDGNGIIEIVNRYPWAWVYKHDIIMVEQFQGEWTPRLPFHSNLVCKTVGAHNKGATQAVAVYWGATAGSETDTTETIDSYNRYDDVGDDIWVRVIWQINGWELVSAEC